MSAYKNFLTSNLYDYVRANSLDDSDLQLREELAIAKHTLGSTLQIYSKLHSGIGTLTTEQQLTALQTTGEYIRKALLDIARLGKYIVEIEATLASRFSGVQVLSALDQVASILKQEFGESDAMRVNERLRHELTLVSSSDNSYQLDEDEFLSLLNSVPRG